MSSQQRIAREADRLRREREAYEALRRRAAEERDVLRAEVARLKVEIERAPERARAAVAGEMEALLAEVAETHNVCQRAVFDLAAATKRAEDAERRLEDHRAVARGRLRRIIHAVLAAVNNANDDDEEEEDGSGLRIQA